MLQQSTNIQHLNSEVPIDCSFLSREQLVKNLLTAYIVTTFDGMKMYAFNIIIIVIIIIRISIINLLIIRY